MSWVTDCLKPQSWSFPATMHAIFKASTRSWTPFKRISEASEAIFYSSAQSAAKLPKAAPRFWVVPLGPSKASCPMNIVKAVAVWMVARIAGVRTSGGCEVNS